MFRFGKKSPSKKKEKKPEPVAQPPPEPSLEPSGKVPGFVESDLAKAKAKADRKSRTIVEKGLPSFEEFGADHLYAEFGGAEEPEKTVKGGGLAAPEEPNYGHRQKTVSPSRASRSPSPLPPVDREPRDEYSRHPAQYRGHSPIPPTPERYSRGQSVYETPTRPDTAFPPKDDYGGAWHSRHSSGKFCYPRLLILY